MGKKKRVSTIREIVVMWLKDNGYDGLYENGECGCKISDLMPCGSESAFTYEPGYLFPKEEIEEGYDFMIGKP